MATWLFCLLVITATYTGNLVAFLLVPRAPVPFNTLKELVEQNQYKYGLHEGTNWITQFSVSYHILFTAIRLQYNHKSIAIMCNLK